MRKNPKKCPKCGEYMEPVLQNQWVGYIWVVAYILLRNKNLFIGSAYIVVGLEKENRLKNEKNMQNLSPRI